MSANRDPKSGHGFVYILSNPSMPGVLKIGITTNSVRRRIQELNSTGVPKSFVLERLFEIDARYIRPVEQAAHATLRQKELHHGKEFFECSIEHCVEAVEDSIFRLTKSGSEELVGQAARRAEEERRSIAEAQGRIEAERRRQALLAERLRNANLEVDAERAAYKEELAKESKVERFIYGPLALVIVGFFCLAFMIATGPIGWVAIPALVYWFYQRDRASTEKFRNTLVERKYPYKTMADLD